MFEANIVIRGFIAGAGFAGGKSSLKFSYDEQLNRENITGESRFDWQGKILERKSAAVVVRSGKAWLVEADYPPNDATAGAGALRIINSMRIASNKTPN